MAKVRSFVATGLNDGVRSEIKEVLKSLRRLRTGVKWVASENMHFTLKFLGDVEEGRLRGDIYNSLRSSLSEHSPFVLQVSGLGAFPNLERPRVIWTGTTLGSEKIEQLHSEIEATLSELGFRPENRKFVPHVTLGRVKGDKNLKALAEALKKRKEIDLGSVRVQNIDIMKSELTPGGPVYSRLKSIDLRE